MMRLRPHHLLDIVKDFEPEHPPEAAESGNAVHVVSRELPDRLDELAEFIIGPDDICAPCSHLQPDGSCERILERHNPPQPIDEYNDPLDARVLAYLHMQEGETMTIRSFLQLVADHVPGIEEVCTHPTQRREDRLAGLKVGLANLGFSVAADA
jgi:hypothetical protein